MKITFNRTPEQIELVKAMASRNKTVAYEAQLALAEFIGPMLAQVVNNAPTLSNLFTSLQFDADDNPSIPLDIYYDITDEDYIQVYSQASAGGLATSQVLPTVSELKMQTYTLDSAVSFDKRYAAKSRMDVLSKTFTRVAQEILAKQEKTSATMILSALSKAQTKAGRDHVQRSNANGRFVLQDINELLTLGKRIAPSWKGGTPASRNGRGITDLMVSPEIVEELRAMAYNPINTKAAPLTSSTKDSIPATDDMRNQIYSAAGIPEFYGIGIMEFNELGTGEIFNDIFDASADAKEYKKADGTGVSAFDGATDQILIGLDRSRESLIRAVAVDDENGGEFVLDVDDQFDMKRKGQIGYYGSLEEGRMILDDRALVGKIV